MAVQPRLALSRLLARLATLCGLALWAGPGCVTTSNFFALPGHDCVESASAVQSWWDPRVRIARDSVNGGAPLPGLAGRLYVLDAKEWPVACKGRLVVDLYDVTCAGGAAEKLLERWQIDNDTLQRLRRRDKIGEGYTLFLPWSTNRPEITRVRLHITFFPEKGAPLYADPVTLTPRNEAPPQVVVRQQTVPAGKAPPAPSAGPSLPVLPAPTPLPAAPHK